MFDKLFSHTILWTEAEAGEILQFNLALKGRTADGYRVSRIYDGITAMRSGYDIHERIYAANNQHRFSVQYCANPETEDLFFVQVEIPMDTQKAVPTIKDDLERLCIEYFGSAPVSGPDGDRVIRKSEQKKGCLAALPALIYALLPSQ